MLTQGLLEVNDMVVILEHVHLVDVLEGLHAYGESQLRNGVAITYRTS